MTSSDQLTSCCWSLPLTVKSTERRFPPLKGPTRRRVTVTDTEGLGWGTRNREGDRRGKWRRLVADSNKYCWCSYYLCCCCCACMERRKGRDSAALPVGPSAVTRASLAASEGTPSIVKVSPWSRRGDGRKDRRSYEKRGRRGKEGR